MEQDVSKILSDIIKARADFEIRDPRFRGLFALNKDNSTWQQSGSSTTGLTAYNLEPGAKFLTPAMSPFRNRIPRVGGQGGIQAEWRSITSVNTNNLSLGVSGGNRAGIMTNTVTNNLASFAGLGMESFVDFEADYAGRTAFDVRADDTRARLLAFMIGEEKTIIGGNPGVALGTTPTPTLVDVGTGGVLLHSTAYYVRCVALAYDAYMAAPTTILASGTAGVNGAITRTNADSSTDTYGGGAAAVSAEATVTTGTQGSSADTHSITATVTAVTGAMGYAWYLGTTTNVERLVAVTTVNTYTFTATPSSTTQLSSALGASDNSKNNLLFSGLLYQALAAGSGAYVATQSGTLTADSAGGIVEIETMLESMWDNSQLGPKRITCNSKQALNMAQKVLANGSSGAMRFDFASSQEMIGGGVILTKYWNKYTGEAIDIEVHRYMPAGTLLATTDTIPYPLSGVGAIIRMLTRQDYMQIDWPLVTRKYQSGIYCDEVLQVFFPPSMGVITNITAG